MIDHQVAFSTHAADDDGVGNLIVADNLESKTVSFSFVPNPMRAKRLKITGGKIVSGGNRMLFLNLAKGFFYFLRQVYKTSSGKGETFSLNNP